VGPTRTVGDDDDLPALGVGATTSVTHTYPPVSDGSHELEAVLDSTAALDDSNRLNDVATFQIVVG